MKRAPVALIVFRRPDLTARVFEAVRRARPPQLFVIADGPRPDRPGEAELCAECREITERVDWDCDVRRDYSATNLGCGVRPASGISWVFSQVDRAIILEDDIDPHPTFFPFCDELLERHADDARVMQVCGHNPFAASHPAPYSYYYSRMLECWGWATWARAWKYHDLKVRAWPRLRDTPWLLDVSDDPRFLADWTRIFENASRAPDHVDYWDYQWSLAFWSQGGLSVMPSVNLSSNLGHRPDGTHTFSPLNRYSALPTSALDFPLRHPPGVFRDVAYDRLATDSRYTPTPEPLRERIRNRVAEWLPKGLRRRIPAGLRRLGR